MLADDLDGEADLDLADSTGGPNLGSRTSICGDYECVCEVPLVKRVCPFVGCALIINGITWGERDGQGVHPASACGCFRVDIGV